MKRTAYKVILVVLVVLAVTFSLCACKAPEAQNGLSAYEIAVKNGFSGSEQEWLESLKSTESISAYDIAVKNGFTGTEKEWLESLTTVIKNIENNYNVDASGAKDVSAAANIGLKSIVSVYCKHTIIVNTWFGQQQQQAQSAGSGVIYKLESDGSAYVITNHHVVYENSSVETDKISKDINLYLYGMEGDAYAIPAKYVGGSLNYDIAVLRVDKNDIIKTSMETGTVCEATFADSDKICVGQTSIAIGNPEAYGISVTSGIVSVDSEYIEMTAVDNKTKIQLRVIRTDTAVNSGNSGGGLFDGEGKLIGIVNAKVSDSEVENIAYAIPSNVAKSIADNIIDYNLSQGSSSVMRVMLGVGINISSMSTDIDETTGYIEKSEKTIINTVNSDSIVKNKLQKNDEIVCVVVDGKETIIKRQYQFIDALLDARVGSRVEIRFVRNGESLSTDITVTNDCIAVY